MLHNGLYEQIINKGLDSELSTTDKLSQTAPIDSAEASKVLAKYVAEIVEKGLNNVERQRWRSEFSGRSRQPYCVYHNLRPLGYEGLT